MTVVNIDIRVPALDGTLYSASGTMQWTPSAAHVDGSTLVLPAPFALGVSGPTTVTLEPTGPSWCWQVRENFPVGGRIRYVAVPSTGPVDYTALVDVDPATLAPMNLAASSALTLAVSDAQASASAAAASASTAASAPFDASLLTTGTVDDARLPVTAARVVPPSGDTSGATDVAAINAAQRAVLVPGSTYYVNGPIVRPSNSLLDATGATIHLTVGGTNILRNAAVAPTRTLTDGVTTAASTTLTSATGSFTSADIGSMIGVVGAALGGATWYGKITAVASATSLTVGNSIPADLSTTGATVNIFANQDADIHVIGGTYILDVAQIDGHQTTSTAFNSFAAMFRRLSGLRIRDTTWSTPGASGQGGKFTLSVADVDDFVIDGTHFDVTAGDGIHITGPASNGQITSTTGTTGDDMVVLNAEDQNTPYITDTMGGLTNILTRGIVATNAWSAFKLYDLGNTKKFLCTGIHLDDVSGTTVAQTVSILMPTIDNMLISRITAAPGYGTALVDLNTNTYATQTTIRDITWTSSNPATAGVVRLSQGRNAIKVSNVSFATAPAGTNIAVAVMAGTNGTTYGLTVLDIDGVYTPMQVSGLPVTFATLHIVDISGSGSGDSTILVRGVNAACTSGYLIHKTTVCPISRIDVSDSTFAGSGIMQTTSGDTKTALTLTDVRFTGTNLVTALSPFDLMLNGVDSACTSQAVVVGAGATPVRVFAGIFRESGAVGGLTRTATQSVRVSGATFPVDVSILTPADGDVAFNSNASLTCGTGPAVYQAAAAKWKGLYTGLTN